ncbi:MAG: type II secretion system F family protein [Clostridia bacterium]|nr:type II secretion system F family protein [Clostridia bacterium]
MLFAYQAVDTSGKKLRGTLEAESQRHALDQLFGRGYTVTSLQEAKDKTNWLSAMTGRGLSLKDLAFFTRQMAALIGAGIPLVEALGVVVKQTSNKRLQEILSQARRDTENGDALWQALERNGPQLPNILISMVRAGEVGGNLDEAFQLLTKHFEREHDLQEEIKAATAYPVVVVCFAIGIALFLSLAVLPRFAAMFSEMGAQLPLPTRVLIGGSNFIRHNLAGIIIGLLALVWGGRVYLQTDRGRRAWDRFLLKAPIIGGLNLELIMARFSRTLSSLVAGGVPILQALEVVEDTVGNTIVSGGLFKARLLVREGESIAGPLQQTGFFNPLTIQLVRVGEESGRLEEMLQHIADYNEKEASYLITRLKSLLEPVLVLILAGMVGFIVAGIMLPLFAAGGALAGA